MSFGFLDLIKGTLESQVFGSTLILAVVVLLVIALLLWKADVPMPHFLLVMAVLVIGMAQSGGLIPSYWWSVGVMIIGVLLGLAFVKLFR